MNDLYGINTRINPEEHEELREVIDGLLLQSRRILSAYPEATGIDPRNTAAVMRLVYDGSLKPADERNLLMYSYTFITQRVVELMQEQKREIALNASLMHDVVRLSSSIREIIKIIDAESLGGDHAHLSDKLEAIRSMIQSQFVSIH